MKNPYEDTGELTKEARIKLSAFIDELNHVRNSYELAQQVCNPLTFQARQVELLHQIADFLDYVLRELYELQSKQETEEEFSAFSDSPD